MEYQELIKNWHSKASSEDYFSKFVFEYMAFNALLRKVIFIESERDRPTLQFLKQNEEIKKEYLSLVRVDVKVKELWESIKSELDKKPLGNVSGGIEIEEVKWWNCSSLDIKDDEQNIPKGVIHGLDDWGNMVEYWSAVRNNLFHGGKDPQNTRDAFLAEHGFLTLRPLVEILMKRTQ
jgi:hypothetical protein